MTLLWDNLAFSVLACPLLVVISNASHCVEVPLEDGELIERAVDKAMMRQASDTHAPDYVNNQSLSTKTPTSSPKSTPLSDSAEALQIREHLGIYRLAS